MKWKRKEFLGKFAQVPKLFELPSLKVFEEEGAALPEKPLKKKRV